MKKIACPLALLLLAGGPSPSQAQKQVATITTNAPANTCMPVHVVIFCNYIIMGEGTAKKTSR